MSTVFSLSVPFVLSCLFPVLTSQLFAQCSLSVLCFLGMQLDNTFTFCKKIPPGLLAFAPVLWFTAQRVSLMQPSVGLHSKKENNTKGYCLPIGLQVASPQHDFVLWPAIHFPLKLFESCLYTKLVPWAALSTMTITVIMISP